MDWKISDLEIANFKFFNLPFKLSLDRKNLLLYGENGSGKSSIYWSLYTHYQAYAKNREQAIKYFTPEHPENLRNRFSTFEDASYVRVTFENTCGQRKIIEDSLKNCYVDDSDAVRFMRCSMIGSDFMNYKFLSSLFDFCNSEENEVFKYFEKEVLPFIDLEEELIDIEGNNRRTINSGEWWQYIKSTYATLPKNQKNYNSYNQREPKYKEFVQILDRFNSLLSETLSMIEAQANAFLKGLFNIDTAVRIEYEDAKFNVRTGKKSRDSKLHPPRILLHAEMADIGVVDRSTIKHPRSFFNEAKITCMALAIRLAVLERRPPLKDAASTLFIDDLLISLDMGFRRQVIKILLTHRSKRQLLIFTHDRSFYHLISSEIDALGDRDNWKKFELYNQIDSKIPKPYLVQNKTYLDEAKVLYNSCNIPACANALRRACEQQLKRILPINMQLRMNNEDSEKVITDLNGLAQQYYRFIKSCGLPDVAPNLQTGRQLILNPFSHDDIDSPFYRTELQNLIKEVDNLSKIKRRTIVNNDSLHTKKYIVKVKNGDYERFADIIFIECYHMLEYDGAQYFTNPRVLIVDTDCTNLSSNKVYGFNAMYRELYKSVSYNSSTAPRAYDCMCDFQTGKSIVSNI